MILSRKKCMQGLGDPCFEQDNKYLVIKKQLR
jgi:hypothetical protein